MTAVENKFSGGVFQQTLDLSRQPQQDIDYAGTAKIAGENSTVYDTTAEEKPKTGPVDYTDEEIAQNNADLGDFEG